MSRSPRSSSSAAAVGLAVGLVAVRMLRQVSLASAGLYPVASLAFAAVAFGGRGRPARLRLPRHLPRRPGHRQLRDARPGGRSRRSTTGSHGSRSSGVPRPGPARVPVGLRRRVARGDHPRARPRVRRPADRRPSRARSGWVLVQRTRRAGMGGAARRVPVVLATFPVIEGISGRAGVLRHRVLRRAGLHAAAGHDVRVALGAARGHDERGGHPDTVHGPDDRPPDGCGDRRVPGGGGRRRRRAPRARARPAA